MPDERVGNWEDAAHVELPPCPKCGACNRPGVVYVERVGLVLLCMVCAHEWMPVDA